VTGKDGVSYLVKAGGEFCNEGVCYTNIN